MMRNKINKKKLILFCVLGLIIGIGFFNSKDVVKAISIDIGNNSDRVYVCYDKKTGAFKGEVSGSGNYGVCKSNGYGYSIVKSINNSFAYCVNWKLSYYTDSNGANYVKDTNWKNNSKDAIISGYLINSIQNVNSKGYGVNEAYARAGAALNSYFSSKIGDAGSYNYSSNSEISGYLKAANTYYNSVKHSKSLPALTINVTGSNVLSYNDTTKKYFSGLITISGFVANYGGSSDTTSYTVSAKTSDGTGVSICTSAKGTSCTTGEVSLPGRSADYSFYLFMDKSSVKAGDDITITVNGSNKSSYYSSILYNDAAHDDAQKLIVISNYNVSRQATKSTILTVPDLDNHRIYVYKVDENGTRLTGANLGLYMDSINGNPLKTNNGSSAMTYSTGNIAANDDDFFKHSYYLVETSAPDGYVFTNSSAPFYKAGDLSANSNVVRCYNSDSGKQEDNEFCNYDNYKYMCKTNTGSLVDTDNNGNCEFDITVGPDNNDDGNISVDSTVGDNTTNDVTNENNTSTDGTNDTTNTDISNMQEIVIDNNITSSVVYDKVCYKIDSSSVVGDEYCSSKELYTKVQHSNGNIIVFQTNSRNVINISKTDITGDKEILGAALKICSKVDYDNSKDSCSPAKTIDDIEMSWISGELAHSIYGVPKGDYYIVETIPPKGYFAATTATAFSINGQGKVVTGDMEITNEEFRNGKSIVVKNEITEFSVSKRDLATKKELPGATISICRTYVDVNGNYQLLTEQYSGDCIEATFADGTVATWKSTNEPKKIQGLKVGTYYLVERIAPTDYSTAESILFTLNDDGTLSDAKGNSLKDNKLVMYDEPLEEKKTGNLTTYIVIGILVGVVVLGVGSIIYLKKTGNKIIKK